MASSGPAEHAPARPALRLTLAYDGAGFRGAQRQAGAARTVQAELERALAELAGRPIRATLAGRTDAGVHAAGQVASCVDPRPDLADAPLGRALNARLPADLAIVALDRVAAGFHARYDARWREYRYRVWSGPPAPLARGLTWQRQEALDPAAMAAAAPLFRGERDLAPLAGGGAGVPWSARRHRPRGTVRTILRCSCRQSSPWWGPAGGGTLVELRVAADGFLPRVVRTIAALLVEVGRGARDSEWVAAVLAAGDRRAGGGTAPPQGLILWRVGYGDEAPEPDEA